jgi:hypothetical protein
MKIYLSFFLIILGTVGLNTIARKYLKRRWNLWLAYGIPGLCMIVFMRTASQHFELFGDFDVGYYPAGRLILENPSRLYYIPENELMPGFVNIPIIALLFTPFSLFSIPKSHVLFVLLSILSSFAACYFLAKLTKVFGFELIALIGFFIINGPLYNSILEGNSTHFVFLLVLAGFFCSQTKREIWSGVLLAIAALVKIPLFLLGIYYVLRGRWRVVVGFSSALLAIVAASVLLFGLDLHMTWFEQCIQRYAGKPMAAYNVQSVDGFLARLLVSSNLTNWLPLEVGWEFKLLRYTLLSLLVGTTLWVCWRSNKPRSLEEENLEFSIALCLALVISPVSWTHYYLFLLLPLSLYLGNQLAVMKGRLWSSLLGVCTLSISLPVIVAEPANPVLRVVYSKLFISHYFFGGVLLLGVLLAVRWQSAKRLRLSQVNNTEVKVAG